jgi:hypothetical protein
MASAWLQLGFSLASAWLQLGFSLASAWLQLGVSLASAWLQLGYATNLNRTGLRLMDLCYDGWTDSVPQKAPTSTSSYKLGSFLQCHTEGLVNNRGHVRRALSRGNRDFHTTTGLLYGTYDQENLAKTYTIDIIGDGTDHRTGTLTV